MLKITIASPALREVPYTDKKGQAQKLYIQQGYAHTYGDDGTANAYPDRFQIVLPRGVVTPYAIGEYTLHPSAISVDNDGRLACSPRLTAVPSKPVAR